jgi:DNA replication protein DnaC
MTTRDNFPEPAAVEERLKQLKLPFMRQHFEALADAAAKENWTHLGYLSALAEGEAALRRDRSVQRRIAAARFPVVKTLDGFNWTWPRSIDRLQVQHLFHLNFIRKKENVVFLGGVGVGKTHLATALGYAACLKRHSVLFTTAIDAINALTAAQAAGRLRQELRKYEKPEALALDELGYLPIDKTGADLLFQIISRRYERGAMIVTTNRAFKDWSEIFNNDSTLASAILDRLLHHSHVVVIEGKSYRMKERIDA